jgi:hypothetical protein
VGWLVAVLLSLLVVGRALYVFPLAMLHNWWSRERLSLKDMIIVWCATMSYLALRIRHWVPIWWSRERLSLKDMIIVWCATTPSSDENAAPSVGLRRSVRPSIRPSARLPARLCPFVLSFSLSAVPSHKAPVAAAAL